MGCHPASARPDRMADWPALWVDTVPPVHGGRLPGAEPGLPGQAAPWGPGSRDRSNRPEPGRHPGSAPS